MNACIDLLLYDPFVSLIYADAVFLSAFNSVPLKAYLVILYLCLDNRIEVGLRLRLGIFLLRSEYACACDCADNFIYIE